MTPFLSTVTERGVNRVERIRAVITPEQMRAFIADTIGSGLYSRADDYVFFCAVAERSRALPRGVAVSYDGAAHAALSAGAFAEALFALEQAEAAYPRPERRKEIAVLRERLSPTKEQVRHEVKATARTRSSRRRRQ